MPGGFRKGIYEPVLHFIQKKMFHQINDHFGKNIRNRKYSLSNIQLYYKALVNSTVSNWYKKDTQE